MPKRFTDTEKWSEDWFLELSNAHKLFWIYICDNCNHAGIFKLNKKMFEFLIGTKINPQEFLSIVNEEKERIKILDKGKWYIVDFIKFQYGECLNKNNRVHNSIIKILIENKINYKKSKGGSNKSRGAKITLPKSTTEVADYFQEKGSNKKEAENFFYFYESKGWKVGDNPMKNWKMAASGWISRNNKNKPDSTYLSSQLDAMKS
tara:strand:+ start:5163 stop:5777 length:615 start_codon:yes stop_codon:yes gene_type:complete